MKYNKTAQCGDGICEGVEVNVNTAKGCPQDCSTDPVVCAQDMKTCPNGLSVSRNPAKNCEFECPKDERIKIMPATSFSNSN